MRVMIASDHEAFQLKQAVIDHLRARGVEPVDAGADGPGVPVDYPDYAQKVGYAVSSGHCDRGIIICGTGLGISIAANKVPGIRAALCDDAETARGARLWNHANVLALSLRRTSLPQAREILDAWFAAGDDPEEARNIAVLTKAESGRTHPQEVEIDA